ncbi:MAG: hypothetical protein E7451_00380 [Ruminococcaceae bacterium]|nr:hypothetical protein [Oscillospiraceae bacterium]
MDTLSSFLNKRVKLADGMSITRLIEKCGISKAKFYRCLSEPFRFTDAQLELIARELRFSESDKKSLFEYKYGSGEDDSAPLDAASEDKEHINKVISDIILGNIKTGVGHNSRVYKLFHSGDTDAGLQICSAGELVKQLMETLSTNNPANQRQLFEGMIFNSCSAQATRNLSALLYALGTEKSFLANYNPNFYHLINDSDLEADGRFDALSGLYQLAAVSTYGCYSILLTKLDETFLGNTDCCLVHYQDKDQKDRYLLINFLWEDEVSVYAFSDCNLYTYLSYQYASIKNTLSSNAPFTLNSLDISSYIIKKSKSFRSTMFTYNLCFDNFVPELWSTVKERCMKDPEILKHTLEQADPSGTLMQSDPVRFVDKLIESFQARFNCCEATERVTILSAAGLQEFVDTSSTSELSPAGVIFDPQEILMQLQYLYDHIGKDHAPGQSFYLIDSCFTPPDIALVIFENSEIGIYFHSNLHTSIFWTMLQQPDIATEFFRYLAIDLIDENTRQHFDSILFSDAVAKDYLSKLIGQVQARIDASSSDS